MTRLIICERTRKMIIKQYRKKRGKELLIEYFYDGDSVVKRIFEEISLDLFDYIPIDRRTEGVLRSD